MSFTPIIVQFAFEGPLGAPASGALTFALTGSMTNGSETITTNAVSVVLDGTGSGSIVLEATDDVGTSPQGRGWRVTEAISSTPYKSYVVSVPSTSDSPVNLSELPKFNQTPVPGSGGPFVPLSELAQPDGVATLGPDGILLGPQRPPTAGGPGISATITGVSPATGTTLGGDTVTITGTNLQSATAVTFGAVPGTIVSASADGTTVTVTTPVEGAGLVAVTLATPIGNPTEQGAFTFVAPAPATITSFSPTVGTTAGGTQVTITGTQLQNATAVLFGAVSVAPDSVSSTSISVTSPSEATSFVNLTVVTPQGSPVSTTQYQYSPVPPPTPTITSLNPTQGDIAGGGTLQINGTNLGAATAVTVGGNAATITANTAGQITVTPPPGTLGVVDVVVTTSGGSVTDAASYTYNAFVAIYSFTPSSGSTAGGTTVTIIGRNLLNPISVAMGGAFGAVISSTNTQIVFNTPAHAAGVTGIRVTTAGGFGDATTSFTFVASAATVTNVSPSSGYTSGGLAVTVTGTNLQNATAVNFGTSNPGTITSNTATTIVVTSPSGSAGAVDIIVNTPQGNVTDTSAFTYNSTPPAAPTITSFSPAIGSTGGGAQISITGTNLGAASAVTVASTSATIVSNTATQIVITAPAHAAGSGAIAVTTAGGTATSSTNYTFQANATVTSFTPATGSTAGGTSVTITGTNLENTQSVYVGGVLATITSDPAGPGDTTLVFTTPAHAAGAVSVVVNGAANSVTAGSNFTYGVPAPTVTGVSPATGSTAGGTAITITGTNLTGATQVLFGTAAATSVVVVNSTTVTCNDPAGAAGVVDVKVTTPGGTGTDASSYTYTGGTGSPSKVMFLAMENLGQLDFSASTSGTMGSLMSSFTYAGSISLGHVSGSNYVCLFSGIDCHSNYYPASGAGAPYTGGTANPDYNATIRGDSIATTFTARTTIFDLVYAAGKKPYVYYDGGTITQHRDPAQFFPRLTTAGGSNGLNNSGVALSTRSGSGASAGALATVVTAHLDADNPDFIYVLPTDDNNGHNSGLSGANTFLSSFIPAVQATSWYANGGSICIWWDEDNGYGGDSQTATWLALGEGSDSREGGAGGFEWLTTVSLQSAVPGGSDLTNGATYKSSSHGTWPANMEAGITSAGFFATACGALGITQTTLAGLTRCTGSYATVLPALIPPPGNPPPSGGPPAMPSGNQTVTVDGTPVTFVPQWSDSFSAATLSSNWTEFQGTSGAGAQDPGGVSIFQWVGKYGGPPYGILAKTRDLGTSGVGLYAALGPITTPGGTLPANNTNSHPILYGGGIGATSTLGQTPPAMVDWAMKIVTNTPHYITPCLWWPGGGGSWPPNQEYDIYENDGTGTVTHQTTHGSTGAAGNTTNLQTTNVLSTHNFNQWTYCRAIWTTTTIQFWAGPDATHLTLQSETPATGTNSLQAAGIHSPGSGIIDTTMHVFDFNAQLENVTSVPAGFSTTPTLMTEIGWVVGYN